MSKRKIIQIAVASAIAIDGTGGEVHDETTIALCDDGSLWSLIDPGRPNGGIHWRRMLPIPQDEDQAVESA
jgi:hypothetical protein